MTELTKDFVLEIAEQRVGDQFRYAKIGSALGIILAPKPNTDIPEIEFLMARHAGKSHEGVKEGMMAPVCETFMAVIEDDNWRPETSDEVAFRSLDEELGLRAADIMLTTANTRKSNEGTWTMSWPMNQPNMPRDVLDTYGVCRMLMTDERDISDISAFDTTEIVGAEWLSIRDVGDILADGDTNRLRPGVHEWFTQALIRLPSFLESWQHSSVELAIPDKAEVICDLRFDVPDCVSKLGLSALRA